MIAVTKLTATGACRSVPLDESDVAHPQATPTTCWATRTLRRAPTFVSLASARLLAAASRQTHALDTKTYAVAKTKIQNPRSITRREPSLASQMPNMTATAVNASSTASVTSSVVRLPSRVLPSVPRATAPQTRHAHAENVRK